MSIKDFLYGFEILESPSCFVAMKDAAKVAIFSLDGWSESSGS